MLDKAGVGPGNLRRFTSRLGRLSHVFLKDRLHGAREYRRIAGYFRSSIFELAGEEIASIDHVRIVCNGDLDPLDIRASRVARETVLKEKWDEGADDIDSLMHRPRYQKLYELLKSGKVEVRVVSRNDAPFLHAKAGVIVPRDGPPSAFIGSLNETREGWNEHYEIVWEDTSPEGVAWVEAEFEYLWNRGVALPDAIIEEVGRSARKREVAIDELGPEDVAAGALVESPIYRRGDGLKPWQRAFVVMFLEHREVYGQARLLLADEVGVGKTLSLATSAMVASLLGDGPALILCPATLCLQWQVELKDKLGIPSAVWLSNRKVWLDHNSNVVKTRGAEDIVRCPYRVGIVSTGLLFRGGAESDVLKQRSYGTLILDEAHRARRSRGLGTNAGEPNNLLRFMIEAAKRAKHVILGTGTPIQTDVDELWDLLDILNQGADHVLGRWGGPWRQCRSVLPLVTGKKAVTDEEEGWNLLRNPLPPRHEGAPLFDHIRQDLGLSDRTFFTDRPVTDLTAFVRAEFAEALEETELGLGFFQRNNPIVRHTVLRKRTTLEEMGLLDRIAVDIWPSASEHLAIFDDQALLTSPEFDGAYQAAEKFTETLRQRVRSVGFLKSMMLQRICSSFASGLATARKLLNKLPAGDEEEANFLGDVSAAMAPDDASDKPPGIEAERHLLQAIIDWLGRKPTDPKLDAVLHFLNDRKWLDLGCIIFSQYFDTANWVAECLTDGLRGERVALYAGADKSGLFFDGEWRSVEREDIKRAVRDRTIRLVVATDAACEGLNLQTLGTLINVDLPWNPSRLQQRIGRIQRFGQTRDRVDMLNLVYKDTRDERVYAALSKRMRDRYDLFGSLPDVIEDEWIENIEHLDEYLSQFTNRQKQANAFDLRYEATIESEGSSWELCEQVLARRNVIERMLEGW
jgi:SNF2 family DNA or RNA helicase